MYKFLQIDHEAFLPGRKWVSGRHIVTIVKTHRFSDEGAWSWDVQYVTSQNKVYEKNGWDFQVRYSPMQKEGN